ncbi:MAG: PilN domain-containing protein [Tepidimonas taiwanensis]|nr:PilN domain-containing protein [Tepidimonas taiwanensis]
MRWLARAWQRGGKRIVSWLYPAVVVVRHAQDHGPARLYDANGHACPGLSPQSWRLWGIRRWHADSVGEDELLRRTWWQPGADEAAQRAAVALRGRLESPFPPEDTLFFWADQPAANGGRQVHALWISRKLLRQRYPQHWQADSDRLLWVELPPGADRWLALPTPGQQAFRRWHAIRSALTAAAWLLALAAAAALAITPTWQLRQRALDAQAQWIQLQKQATPALVSRQQLTVAMEHIDAFDRTTASLRDPVALLNWVTEQLPDDTYVSELEYEGDTLGLQGLTPNAAALMRHLGEQPGVAAVTASRPATKVTGLGKESYFIEIRLSPEPSSPSAAPGAAAQP